MWSPVQARSMGRVQHMAQTHSTPCAPAYVYVFAHACAHAGTHVYPCVRACVQTWWAAATSSWHPTCTWRCLRAIARGCRTGEAQHGAPRSTLRSPGPCHATPRHAMMAHHACRHALHAALAACASAGVDTSLLHACTHLRMQARLALCFPHPAPCACAFERLSYWACDNFPWPVGRAPLAEPLPCPHPPRDAPAPAPLRSCAPALLRPCLPAARRLPVRARAARRPAGTWSSRCARTPTHRAAWGPARSSWPCEWPCEGHLCHLRVHMPCM